MMKMVSKAKKQLLANQLNKLLFDTHEDALKKAVSRFFRKLEKNLIKEVEVYWENLMFKGQFDLMLSPIHEAQEEYHDLILEYTLAEFNRGVKQGDRLVSRAIEQYVMKANRNVGAFYEKGDPLFATSQFAEDRLRDTVFQASDKTMARVDESINEILTQGYKEGWGVKDVRNRLMTRFDQLKDWEANRIARTEMQHAHNLGIMHSYEQNNVQHIQWRSAVNQPMRTRPSHIALNGEIIRVGDRFSNGLQFPGDKTGKIEEWINCRCSCPPYILPPGMSAPPGRSYFRESDLLNVGEIDYNKVLREHTGGALDWEQFRQVLQGKSLEDVGAIVSKIKEESNPEIDSVLADIMDEYGLSNKPKPKKPEAPKPKVKVNVEKPKPKVDVDDVLASVLDDYGLNKKPKKKTTPKPKKQTAPKEISLEEHLRKELPADFTDEAINYIADKVRRRGNAKREYGQIFDYKTGRNTSPEFKGGKSAVNIKEKDWIKPLKQFTQEEMIDALSNRSKYEKSYVDKSNSLASIHNHPSDGSRAFSGADIYITATNKWEDYGIAVSDKEVWISKYKGQMADVDAKAIEKKVDRLFNKSSKQAMKKVMQEYDHLPYKEKRQMESELLKDIFGDNLLEFFNKKNKDWGIELKRVRYRE